MRRLLAGTLAALFALSPSFAQEQEPLRYVYTDYFPANYHDEEGRPAGFFVEILREALENRLGIPISICSLPWARCQGMVLSGRADILTTVPTKERTAYSLVVEPPIWIKNYRLFTWKGHPDKDRMDAVRDLEDLKERNLTILSYIGNNWAAATLTPAGINVVEANTVEGMYRMLNARRADAIIEDPVLVLPALKELGFAESIVPTEGITGHSDFHILVGAHSPYANQVADISRTLEAMYADGTIDRIMARYRTQSGE